MDKIDDPETKKIVIFYTAMTILCFIYFLRCLYIMFITTINSANNINTIEDDIENPEEEIIENDHINFS
jgi:hypothetical protein